MKCGELDLREITGWNEVRVFKLDSGQMQGGWKQTRGRMLCGA